MDTFEDPRPLKAKSSRCFIQAWADALQGGIKPSFGNSQEAVAVAPKKQHNRSQLPWPPSEQQGQSQHGARNGIARAGKEGEALEPARVAPALGDGQHQRNANRKHSSAQAEEEAAEAQIEKIVVETASQLIQVGDHPQKRGPQGEQRG